MEEGPGISAADRAVTVRTAVARNAVPADIVTPGHIFPIMARSGGVLSRAGHTEAGCDLARMAGFEPAAVIVEILNEDGSIPDDNPFVNYIEQDPLVDDAGVYGEFWSMGHRNPLGIAFDLDGLHFGHEGGLHGIAGDGDLDGLTITTVFPPKTPRREAETLEFERLPVYDVLDLGGKTVAEAAAWAFSSPKCISALSVRIMPQATAFTRTFGPHSIAKVPLKLMRPAFAAP